ncbi:PstS family phosphate ABC transporter substrate-binding protein [Candidatus Gracilibacteria bacterium]|nr:PstS family phosphate ABC transporter substrate-binding protein [Candidatus Gracilibacteria bacterium]NJM86926.1 PstS family phosphate ABC transporter substrate-binding protein [Hydrococcus sp. RU_2_2]
MLTKRTTFRGNRWLVMSALAVFTATLTLAIPAVYSQSQATIKVDGSSTVYPITEAVAEDFQATGGGERVTVGLSGTGGGFKKFCAGETDISNASRPIKDEEIQACKAAGINYIELPVAYDALTVVVNPQNNWISSMTVAELKKLWEPAAQGKITNWSQVRSGWPNAPIKLFGPGADSGTFDYFTDAIVGEEGASRTDYLPSEDDNVLVQGVSRDKNALGYFGFAYYEANKDKLKSIGIDGGKGAVMPSAAAVQNGTYQPLSRPLFIYVSSKAAQRPEVKKFVEFFMTQGASLVQEVGYVPLPAQAYQLAMKNFNSNKMGSIFAGRETVGVRIEQLLQLEAR